MKKVFEGPGRYLVIPLVRVTNPKCEHVSFPLGRKAWEKNPPCLCVNTRLFVPYGWYYTETPHAEIFEPKVYERDGYKFTYGKVEDLWDVQ